MNFSVLVLSCDKYLNMLDLFFKYYKRFCNLDVPLYLSLEKADYRYDGLDIHVLQNETSDWSTRLSKSLNQISSKAVLILLEDFLIEEPVDKDELNKLADLINNNDEIAHFALTPVPMKNDSGTIYYERYYKRHRYGRYKTTLQAGMWNRSELLSVIKAGESAWEREMFGNMRSYLSRRDYYAIADRQLKPIKYNDGFFCVQGRLNEAELERLEKKFGEDFHVEGMETDHGVMVRDRRSFVKRVRTRLRIMGYGLRYRIAAAEGKTLEKT